MRHTIEKLMAVRLCLTGGGRSHGMGGSSGGSSAGGEAAARGGAFLDPLLKRAALVLTSIAAMCQCVRSGCDVFSEAVACTGRSADRGALSRQHSWSDGAGNPDCKRVVFTQCCVPC